MDPRYLIISPEDETGGRQSRFFSWAMWGIALVVLVGVLAWSGMYWQAAAVVAVALAVTVGYWALVRRSASRP